MTMLVTVLFISSKYSSHLIVNGDVENRSQEKASILQLIIFIVYQKLAYYDKRHVGYGNFKRLQFWTVLDVVMKDIQYEDGVGLLQDNLGS